MLIGAPDVGKVLPFLPWRGALIHLIGVPILVVTLVWLMFWNFKRVLVNGKVWRWNTMVVIASLTFVIGITSAVYHRVWEFLTPLEPTHGAARLSSSDSVEIESLGSAISVQFHDGRVWSGNFVLSAPNLMTMLSGNWKMKPLFGGGKFLDLTNWASVAISHNGMFGIQKDGSLWGSEEPRKSSKEESKLVRIGEENNWKAVSGPYPWARFLKQDGTLWRLNAETWNWKKAPWPGIKSFKVEQMGANSDWAEIFWIPSTTVFRKKDGDTWTSNPESHNPKSMKLDKKETLFRAEFLDGLKSSTRAWPQLRVAGDFQLGVGKDGRLVVGNGWSDRQAISQSVQIGNDSDWLAVAGKGEEVAALKKDGSLWKLTFPKNPVENPKSASAVSLSKHSDWVAITEDFGSVISLAADGSVWFWQFDSRYFSPGPEGISPLLSASRKPQKIANIFDAPRIL
jgi:hypothetical protein